MTIILCFNW